MKAKVKFTTSEQFENQAKASADRYFAGKNVAAGDRYAYMFGYAKSEIGALLDVIEETERKARVAAAGELSPSQLDFVSRALQMQAEHFHARGRYASEIECYEVLRDMAATESEWQSWENIIRDAREDSEAILEVSGE